MQTFFKPVPGVIGDTIPYFHDGRYHVFYLRDHRDPDSYGIGSAWDHISTTDFVNFTDHGVALAKGGEHDQDLTVATGSVYTDENGLHHIFYTGINPLFRNDADKREQGIMHATSPDLDSWTKVSGELWFADESRYERHDWRDPFVYRDPTTGRVLMAVAARTIDGEPTRRGCTAILSSVDLSTWTDEDATYAPHRYHGHECPDLFRMGEWYYLVFSEYTTRTATRYVMSRSPLGPWTAPANNLFDNRACYAAKSAGAEDGPRYLFGWNPTKLGNHDAGEWQWGGSLTVHEILQNDDGTLRVRMPVALDNAFAAPVPNALDTNDTSWTGDGAVRGTAASGYAATFGALMPASCLIEGELIFDSVDGEAGVLLNVDEHGNGGYFLRFSPAHQALQFGKVGGYRDWYVDHMPELDRPLPVKPGVPLRYRIVVDETAIVAYVNDAVALSARMYSRPRGRNGVYVDGVTATFSGHSLRPRHL